MDLKNNKKKKDLPGAVQFASLKKITAGIVAKRVPHSIEALRVTLDDIENIETKGRWWAVGAAWKGSDEREKDIKDSSQLLDLARAHKMNTDARRAIFVAVMGSEDFVDAYERIVKMGLKEKQQRDIIIVILHCCQQVIGILMVGTNL